VIRAIWIGRNHSVGEKPVDIYYRYMVENAQFYPGRWLRVGRNGFIFIL